MSILDRSPIAAARRALETNPDVVASAANAAQSTEGIVPAWKASTTYSAGQRVIAPSGDIVAAKTAFTSGASYSSANWNPSSQDGRIGAVEAAAATAMQPWKANTAYAAGARVVAPNGDIVSAKVAFTSGASYSAANWNPSSQDGRIGTLEATTVPNALADAKSYTNTKDTANRSDWAAADAALAARPGMPNVGDDLPYADATVDQSGHMSDATLPDGTRYLPSMKSDVAKVAGATHSVGDGADYADATIDQNGRIAEATLPDGTRYIPRLKVDSITAPATPDATPIDVMIMAGQSNSTYSWNSDTDPVLHPLDPRLMVWDNLAQSIAPVQLKHPDDIPKGIARAMRRAYPDRAVLIVPTSVGGTGFTGTSLDPAPAGYHTNTNGNGTWDRFLTADPKNLVPIMISNAKAAIAAAGTRLGNVTFAWVQGESDASFMTQAQMQTALDDLFTYTRSQLSLPDMPIVVGGLVPERIDAYSESEKGVVRAHIDTPRRLTRTAYQPGPRDYSEYLELVHYSKPGRAIHGTGMFGAMERAMLNVTSGKPIMPHNLAIRRLVDAVTITWDAPPCRATSYNLETSTDSGATWTAQTLADGPLGLSHTMTIPAATRVRARISTTNEVGTSITTEVQA